MTRQRRILLCRLGFVLFCLVPTLTVGLAITIGRLSHAPGALDEESKSIASDLAPQIASRVSLQLGLDVEIEHAEGTPHAMQLNRLRLIDPETRECVLEAAAIDAAWQDGVWKVTAHQPVVNLALSHRLLPRLHDRLLCSLRDESRRIEITSASLLADAGGQKQSFGPAALLINQRLDGQTSVRDLALELSLDGSSATEPLRLTASRVRESNRPHTNWQLNTGGESAALPFLAILLPEVSRLGADCHFTGSLHHSGAEEVSRLEATGTLTNVDFDALVTEHFPHQLSGLGTIHIEQAVVQDRRLVEFRGGIDIMGGSASHSLLVAAQQHLGLVLAADPPESERSSTSFERMSLDFVLDGRLLRIRGTADREKAVILASTGPVLLSATNHAVPAVNLLRALLPDNQFQVPATRQTDALVSLLPVPDIAPTRTATRPAHVPTRLRDSGPADAAPVLRQPGLR